MGRTVLPYSRQIDRVTERFKKFRQGLRKKDQETFDQLIRYAKNQVQAGVSVIDLNPIDSMFMSMMIELQNQVNDLHGLKPGHSDATHDHGLKPVVRKSPLESTIATRSHSYFRLNYHIIFVTRKRLALIDDKSLSKLRKLFDEKAKELHCTVHIANGYEDHVHLLITTPAKESISNVAKNFKGYSSRHLEGFYWKNGYAAYSVDDSSFQRIFNYILNQEEHHKNNQLIRELEILENLPTSLTSNSSDHGL